MAQNSSLQGLLIRRSVDWTWWMLANSAGGLVSWAIVGTHSLATLSLMFLIAWLPVGIYLGVTQYIVITRRLQNDRSAHSPKLRPSRWIIATILGLLLQFLAEVEVPYLLFSHISHIDAQIARFMGYVAGGLIYGVLQALAIDRAPARLIAWSLVCALGWSVGKACSITIAQAAMDRIMGYPYDAFSGFMIGPEDALYGAIEGIVCTVIFGAITSLFLSPLRWRTPALPDTLGTPQIAQNDPG